MPSPKQDGQEEFSLGTVINRDITDEMHEAYLDYAMSVIVSRALPDVRDGLKPVHRRILYAMWDGGYRAAAKYRKSAAIVGEVLGRYHPHGDSAVYDAMVRMAQDFAMRVQLVDGQGNFGSVDGDSAAAMRYTEAKLTRVAEEMLFDIEKETVVFNPNYDGTHKEPSVLPAKLPNLLLNGTVGIAVGMATSIPPHNLGELCNAVVHLVDCEECSVDHLMEYVKGPDFPTGGIIYNVKDITTAYMTGRGGVVMRAKADIVENKQGQFQIIIEEIPYQVNKSTLLEKIAELVREKKIEGIRDLRDESAKGEIRIVVELKKEAYPKKVLNQLFKYTQLQDTFHFNTIALVDGIQPRILNLKAILDEFIAHRKIVIVKRTEYDLERARDRAHILQGLKIALDNIDAVIKTIKASKDKEVAKEALMAKFKLSERQSVAILEMRLQQLANLERMKIEDELNEKLKLIKELEELLASPKKIMGVIKDETTEIRDKYATERKTHIIKGGVGELTQEDLIPNEPTLVMITRDGYIKRMSPDTFKAQARGGKGIIGLTTKEEDTVDQMFGGMTHNDLLFFTTKGRVFKLKAYDVPVSSRTAKGTAVVNFLQLASNEKVSKIISLADMTNMKYLVMVTKKGLIKKTELSDFDNVRKTGLIAIKLKDEDSLLWVSASSGNDDIMMVTSEGQSIRFSENDVRAMGRAAAGVTGIRVKSKDEVVGMDIVSADKRGGELFVVTNDGYGKRTALTSYKVQHRGGSGIKTVKLTAKNGHLIFAHVVYANQMPEDMSGDVLIISQKGQVIRFTLKSVPSLGRDTQGVRVMRFKEKDDKVASIALV